jgi:hypothetical protein
MKKLLLIGLILAICILAMPQGVLADEKSATINANIVTQLTFTATGRATEWALSPTAYTTTASNADGITFVVNSNAAWGVNPKQLVGQTPYMTPVDMTESGAAALGAKLEVENLAGTGFQFIDDTTDIVQGGANSPAGETRWRAIRQWTTLTDHRLTKASNYYTGTFGFECIQNA